MRAKTKVHNTNNWIQILKINVSEVRDRKNINVSEVIVRENKFVEPEYSDKLIFIIDFSWLYFKSFKCSWIRIK